MVDRKWLSHHRRLNTPPQSGCREMSRFVHKAANIMLQFFVVSIIEDRQYVHRCELLVPVTLLIARVLLTLCSFFTGGMGNPSFLPTCPELLVAHVLSSCLQRSPAYPACSSRRDRACSTVEPTSSAPPSALLCALVQDFV